MEEVDNAIDPVDNAIDPDNDISYGISNKGYEVMIVNDRALGLIRALGLLPINDVMIGYQVILDSDHYQQIIIRGTELQLINNINSLTTYLTTNYINNNKIPQWNVHDLNDHRTNNDMEGYHHRLRERFTNRISNFWGFKHFILKETFIILERMRGGDVMPGSRRTYQRKANYEQDHDILVFLTNARLCINN